jgi:hypothetical protein
MNLMVNMSREYKNILKLRDVAYGTERRKNLNKEIVKNSTPIPLPLEYEDIDKEFKRWVEEELHIDFENEKLPTFTLYSNQRFSEFLQSWDKVDEKRNLIMNFKTITRENNPKEGTLLGATKNIPGDYYILMKRVKAFDENKREYYIDYKMKQPFTVDLNYTLGLVTNKYELLNKFNQLVNDKFKAINCYIRPNEHFIPMKLENVSDESEYNIDNRIYYSQNYTIKVMAYIIPADSYVVEEKPIVRFMGIDGDITKGSYAEIEELPCKLEKEREYNFNKINLTVNFDKNTNFCKFKIDINFKLEDIVLTNVRSYRLFVNDVERSVDDNLYFNNGDNISIKGLVKLKSFEDAVILFKGFDFSDNFKV